MNTAGILEGHIVQPADRIRQIGKLQGIAARERRLANGLQDIRQGDSSDTTVVAESMLSNAGDSEGRILIGDFGGDENLSGELRIAAPTRPRVPNQLHRVRSCHLVPKITCLEAVVQVRCLAVVVLQLLIGHTGANRNMAAGREAGSRSGTYNSGTIPQACNPAPLVHRGHRLIGAGPGKRNGGKLVRADGIGNLLRCPHIQAQILQRHGPGTNLHIVHAGIARIVCGIYRNPGRVQSLFRAEVAIVCNVNGNSGQSSRLCDLPKAVAHSCQPFLAGGIPKLNVIDIVVVLNQELQEVTAILLHQRKICGLGGGIVQEEGNVHGLLRLRLTHAASEPVDIAWALRGIGSVCQAAIPTLPNRQEGNAAGVGVKVVLRHPVIAGFPHHAACRVQHREI